MDNAAKILTFKPFWAFYIIFLMI